MSVLGWKLDLKVVKMWWYKAIVWGECFLSQAQRINMFILHPLLCSYVNMYMS